MTRAYAITTRPVIHVHELGSEDHSTGIFGPLTLLEPHPTVFDYETCGLTAEPNTSCVAYVKSTGTSCRKAGIVVMAVPTSWPDHYGRFHLCGSHFASHRLGRVVKLAI